ncbi:dihydrodipicolinate synthase family protein [Ochrobactrum sp. POC9]|uniref:dihydrodipicolinate synthase family protein n=1 Tax=unclassified Ochrobactrum TaxID=239106 RepID=UPI000D708462|nr:dihydrodipicolinate synthase family protein [Ochrobactrum sp. POC9]MCH4543008.1 dihydrodipicolinate synthase family protein [Ochrobactrum sp. A-1]PWU72778.1 dihydrodipicolinate synthase family protein [Ochrobactrum sp. POC9]
MSHFYGVIPYLVSPLKADGNINEKVLGDLCNDLIGKGVTGLTPLGSSGEYAYLSDEKKRRIVEVVVEASNGRVSVVPGVASVSTEGAIEQARLYKKIGADGIVGVLESYFPLSEQEVRNYFLDIANSVDLPIVVYTNPNFQRTDLSIDTISTIADHRNIVGLKDASTNTGRLLSIINRCEGKLDVFAASSHIAVSVLLMGGKGWFAGPACVLPEQSIELYNACKRGEWEHAAKIQKRLWGFNEVFARYRLASCLKAALQIQGYEVGDPIRPQTPLDANAVKIVKDALQAASAL